jgi:hypothetical protein
MTTNLLFSLVQKKINDITFSKVERQEYIVSLDNVMQDIARECDVFFSSQSYSVGVDMVEGDFFFDILVSNIISPIKIEYLKRGKMDNEGNYFFSECREISYASVLHSKDSTDKDGYNVNSSALGTIFYAVQVISVRNALNQYVLRVHFTSPFQADEQIHVYATTSQPYGNPVSFASTLIDVPSHIAHVAEFGILSYVTSLLYFGFNQFGNQYQLATAEYESRKKKLKSYVINLKTKSSPIIVQPFKFLGEGVERSVGDPGIPEEWYGNILGASLDGYNPLDV